MAQLSASHHDFATFGELLRHLRKRAGLTQRDLAQAVNYTNSFITRLENNTRSPDPSAVRALFIDALHLQREPEMARRLIQLAEMAKVRDKLLAATPAIPPTQRNTNLPALLTAFVGRVREVGEVMRLAGAARLLTLTGAGGVGKTRLAMQAASLLNSNFPDGVWLVELASITEPDAIAGAAASVFNLAHEGLSPLAIVTQFLTDKQALLVLDNCEHLIDACARLVERVLKACPDIHILATSREPLKVPGEVAWRVPPMAVDDAVKLFEARALESIPETALNAGDAATIARICTRLDGIPLAIELAAARLRVYSLEMIDARLDERFKLLTDGARTALPRHQTLQALIDWSYNLLSEEEQQLLRLLSVFAGGWTLEGVEAANPDLNVIEWLPRLVDKSLVVMADRAGQRRYSMLETIRQYAAEKLTAQGETDLAFTRMAAYLELISKLLGRSRTAAGLMALKAEMDNVRRCVAWSQQGDPQLALRLVAVQLNHFGWDSIEERLIWLADAIERCKQASPDLRLNAVTHQLSLTYFTGRHMSGWLTHVDEYLALADLVNEDEARAELLFWAGLIALHAGEFSRTVLLHSAGLNLTRNSQYFLEWETGKGQAIANFAWGIGLSLMKLGDTQGAAKYFLHALQTGRDSETGSTIFMGLSGYAWMDPQTALVLCADEMTRLKSMDHDVLFAHVLQACTQSLILLKRYAEAEALLTDCRVLWHKLGVVWESSVGSAQALLDLGQVAWLQGDMRAAQTWFAQSLDEYRQVGDCERIARLHAYIGLTELAEGNLEAASRDFHYSLQRYCELGQPAGIALALAAHARLAEARGDSALAATLFGAASVPQELLAVSILWPASPVIYQREIAQARERFSGTPWMANWVAGERMTHELAIALAI